MKTVFKLAIALTAGLFFQQLTFAQEYPAKPIRLIIPFAAGGGSDVSGRTIADKLASDLGQPVFIDNRSGAGGALGASVVAHSPPDGYTLMFTNNAQAILPNLQKTDWDALKDFKAVAGAVTFTTVILVNANSPIKTLPELIAAAKARPGKLTYGSSGIGGPLHLAMEMFRTAAGIDLIHVPYKGNAPMTTALLSNEIDMSIDTFGVSLPQIKAGKFRALAVTSPKRSTLLPNVPTVSEVAVPGFEYEGWSAFFAPANTPPAVIARLSGAIDKALAMPSVRQRLLELGYEPKAASPEQLTAVVAKDLQRYRKIIQDNNIKAE